MTSSPSGAENGQGLRASGSDPCTTPSSLSPAAYDIIGDIHGHAHKLEALLEKMGYAIEGDVWRHPECTAIFVGDLIDRGRGQLHTLNLVRGMVEAGSARAVLGNHEFNAIAYATPDPESPGDFLRTHHGEKGRNNHKQHDAFLAEIGFGSPQYRVWIDWFMSLPLWLEGPGLRVVHACWDPGHVAMLRPQLGDGDRLTPTLLEKASRRGSKEYAAVQVLLKGQEVRLPQGRSFKDKEGHVRHDMRTRWWDRAATTYRTAYMGPPGADLPDDPVEGLQAIPAPDRPTFIGHYWLAKAGPFEPVASQVVCVDYSAGTGGPLVAYRFNGETALSAEKFVLSE